MTSFTSFQKRCEKEFEEKYTVMWNESLRIVLKPPKTRMDYMEIIEAKELQEWLSQKLKQAYEMGRREGLRELLK